MSYSVILIEFYLNRFPNIGLLTCIIVSSENTFILIMNLDTRLFLKGSIYLCMFFLRLLIENVDEQALKIKKNIKIIFVMELQLFGINHKTSKLSERELFIIMTQSR